MVTAVLIALIAQAPTTKIAVIPTHVDDNAKAEVPELFDDHVLTAVQSLEGISAIGQDDINAMIGLEQQKELLGCDDASCFAEIGGALGVDKLMVLKVARVGAKWAVTAKVMTTSPPSVENRTSNFVDGDIEALMEAMSWIVPEVFGRPSSKPGTAAATSPGPAIEAEVIETSAEPIPDDPTAVEISVRMGMFPGHPNSPDLPDSDTGPEGTTLLQKELTVAPTVGWRYADLGPLNLVLEGTVGFASVHSFQKETDGGSTSTTTGGASFLWVEVMQLVRLPFYSNNERFLLLPSDRAGVELGIGGHAVVGSATELGLSTRLALYGSWFMIGAQLVVGNKTNLQFGPVFGVRFGF